MGRYDAVSLSIDDNYVPVSEPQPSLACLNDGSDSTLAILYIYTSQVPASVVLADQIRANSSYSAISVLNADSPDVRNYLLYGSNGYVVTQVPVFLVVYQDTTSNPISYKFLTYSVNQADEIYTLALSLKDEDEPVLECPPVNSPISVPKQVSQQRLSESYSNVLDGSISVEA